VTAPPTLHLVDASPYVFRAYYALPATITDREGRPVHAVHGFLTFLLQLFESEDPTHLAVAFDESLTTSFRNEIYADYKAQRELPPPELEAQLELCRDGAAALGAATFADERYEADDFIATLCARFPEASAIVISNDKDLGQLVSDRVTWFDFARGERYDPERVRVRFGVRPDQIVDYLALAGDSVDNIPGVRGIGPKSAVALLAHLDDLDRIYADLDAVSALPVRGATSLRRKLEEGQASARLSRRLALAATDAPVSVELDDLRYRGADREAVAALAERLDSRRLQERIPRWR
jgi:5'-3' exonuclease